MLCCLNHGLCCYTKGFITFCFTDSLVREPLELSLPSETLNIVLRCFSDSYVPNFCWTFPAPNPNRACIILKSLIKLGAFSWGTLFFLIRNNESFKETLGQSEKSSIYSKWNTLLLIYPGWHFVTQTPHIVKHCQTLRSLVELVAFDLSSESCSVFDQSFYLWPLSPNPHKNGQHNKI